MDWLAWICWQAGLEYTNNHTFSPLHPIYLRLFIAPLPLSTPCELLLPSLCLLDGFCVYVEQTQARGSEVVRSRQIQRSSRVLLIVAMSCHCTGFSPPVLTRQPTKHRFLSLLIASPPVLCEFSELLHGTRSLKIESWDLISFENQFGKGIFIHYAPWLWKPYLQDLEWWQSWASSIQSERRQACGAVTGPVGASERQMREGGQTRVARLSPSLSLLPFSYSIERTIYGACFGQQVLLWNKQRGSSQNSERCAVICPAPHRPSVGVCSRKDGERNQEWARVCVRACVRETECKYESVCLCVRGCAARVHTRTRCSLTLCNWRLTEARGTESVTRYWHF